MVRAVRALRSVAVRPVQDPLPTEGRRQETRVRSPQRAVRAAASIEKRQTRQKPAGSPSNGSEGLAAHPDFLLAFYLRDILPIPLLTAEEELDLAQRARSGESLARERLVVSHLRLVVHLAFDYQGLGQPVPDLISEGNIGLILAAERFKPEFGARFATYATAWIKQRMRRALSNQSRLVRVPLGVIASVARVRSIEERLQVELGRSPTETELARGTELSCQVVRRLRQTALHNYVSLDASGAIVDGPDLAEWLPDAQAKAPFEALETEEQQQVLEQLMQTLEPRAARVLRLRFGLEDGQPRTLEEVGQVVGLVRQRVQQIEASALELLRKRWRLAELDRKAA